MAFSANIASLFVNVIVNWQNAGKNLNNIQARMQKAALAAKLFMGVFAARTFVSTMSELVRTAAELEKKFTDIRKVLPEMSGTSFDLFANSLLNLTKELKSLPIDEIQDIALIGAQLGIDTAPQIREFTDAVAKASIAAESLHGAKLAEFLGRLMDIYGTGTDAVKLYANALTHLANEFNTNEKEIVATAERLFGLTKAYGISEAQLLAWATAARASGQQAERASTAIGLLFARLMTDPEAFADTIGADKVQFTNLVLSDLSSAANQVLDSFNKLSSFDVTRLFGDMEIGGQRAAQVLTALAQNMDTRHRAFRESEVSIIRVTEVENKLRLEQDNLLTSITALTNAWKIFKAELGESSVFESLIKDVTFYIDALTQKINSLDRKKGSGPAFGEVSANPLRNLRNFTELKNKQAAGEDRTTEIGAKLAQANMARKRIFEENERRRVADETRAKLLAEASEKAFKFAKDIFREGMDDGPNADKWDVNEEYLKKLKEIQNSGLLVEDINNLTRALDELFNKQIAAIDKAEQDRLSKEAEERREAETSASRNLTDFILGGHKLAEEVQNALEANDLLVELKKLGADDATLTQVLASMQSILGQKAQQETRMEMFGIEQFWSQLQQQTAGERQLTQEQLLVLKQIDLGIDELVRLGGKNPLAVVGP